MNTNIVSSLSTRQARLYESILSYDPDSADRYAALVNDPGYLERPEKNRNFLNQRLA
jgi:hypothetical protein